MQLTWIQKLMLSLLTLFFLKKFLKCGKIHTTCLHDVSGDDLFGKRAERHEGIHSSQRILFPEIPPQEWSSPNHVLVRDHLRSTDCTRVPLTRNFTASSRGTWSSFGAQLVLQAQPNSKSVCRKQRECLLPECLLVHRAPG